LVARPCPSNTAQWPCHQLRPTPTASLVRLFWIAVERLPHDSHVRRQGEKSIQYMYRILRTSHAAAVPAARGAGPGPHACAWSSTAQ
jgi:hypothetical protein